MRIALINPPFFAVYGGYEKAARIGACYPPAGLLYLASSLEADGHEVKLYDVDVLGLTLDELIRRLGEYRPDLIGITATTPIFHRASEIAVRLKQQGATPIVIGGYHVTILRDEAFGAHPEFDYAVLGEGEVAIRELVKCVALGEEPASVNGILYRKNGAVVATAARPLVKNLDDLPFPARHITDKDSYLWVPPRLGTVPIASILTKRGCPFNCSFCSQHSMFSRMVRYRSVENVLAELDEIVNRHGIKYVLFLDDTLVLKKDRMLKLCEGIRERKLEFHWEGMTRANLIDEETLQTMASVGLSRLSFGIESGDQEILDRIEKGVTLEQIRTAYHWAKKAGIETRGSAIIGHPGETARSAWKTIWFLRGLTDLDHAYLNIMVPYPGTPVYELASRGQAGYRLLSTDFNEYIRYNRSVLEVNDLDTERLKRLQNSGLLLFYFTPRRILYNLRRAGIKNGIVMAFAMLLGMSKSGLPEAPGGMSWFSILGRASFVLMAVLMGIWSACSSPLLPRTQAWLATWPLRGLEVPLVFLLTGIGLLLLGRRRPRAVSSLFVGMLIGWALLNVATFSRRNQEEPYQIGFRKDNSLMCLSDSDPGHYSEYLFHFVLRYMEGKDVVAGPRTLNFYRMKRVARVRYKIRTFPDSLSEAESARLMCLPHESYRLRREEREFRIVDAPSSPRSSVTTYYLFQDRSRSYFVPASLAREMRNAL